MSTLKCIWANFDYMWCIRNKFNTHKVWYFTCYRFGCKEGYTLIPRDYDSGDYDLMVTVTWNCHSKYSSLIAMLICPVITKCYIDVSGDYDLKMSKIDRWLTFPSQ